VTLRLDSGTGSPSAGVRALGAVASVGAALAAGVVGYLAVVQPMAALGVAALVLVAGVSVRQPAALPLLAMPLMVVVVRAGSGSVEMTVSDLALGLAFWPAVLLAPRPFSPELRKLLWLNVLYQAATLLTVVANPFLANTVEWFHAWLLVSGGLILGWAVGRSGYGALGIGLFLVSCALLATGTVVQGAVQWASGNFSAVYPSWPWEMHKNFIGTLLCLSAVVAFARPHWLRWPRWALRAVFWISAAGIAFAQSRQALVALAVVLVVVSLRAHPGRRRSWLVAIGMAPVLLVVGSLVQQDVESGNVHNSVLQRLTWFEDSYEAWLTQPWLGHGLRFWYNPEGPLSFQPPQMVLESLVATGVVGTVALLFMLTAAFITLWRLDPTYGTLASSMVLARLVQGQFDLFWVSISVSVPFVIVGVCLGVKAAVESAPRVESGVGGRGAGKASSAHSRLRSLA
jgi:polysaccharide biosynthesis protein PslJ